jgi:hypothetical protein
MHLKGRLSINLVVLVVTLLLDGETFSRRWFRALSGGDALLLSVGSPSEQE